MLLGAMHRSARRALAAVLCAGALLAPAAGREDEAAARLRGQLERHPYFSTLVFELDASHAPFLFAAQQALGARADAAARGVRALAPWAVELERVLATEFAVPGGWQRRPGSAPFPVLVLASRGAFDDYARVLWGTDAAQSGAWSHYDERTGLIALHLDRSATPGAEPRDLRMAGLRELARCLLRSYSAGRPLPFWMEQGFADFLSMSQGDDPGTLRLHPLEATHVRALARARLDEREWAALWLPLPELLALEDWREASARAARRAKELELPPPPPATASFLARVECALFVHFLLYGEAGARRGPFLAALKAALKGDGAQAGAELFAGEDLAALEEAFLRYALAAHRRLFPDDPQPAPPDAPAGGGDSAAARDLATRLPHERARVALALARLRAGDAESAAALLEQAAARAEEPLRARAARELERARAWIALRDRFLDHVVRSGAKLSIEHAGRELSAPIERREGDVLVLGKNSAGIERLPVRAVAALELARQMGAGKHGFEGGWPRAYAYFLGGLPAWKRQLDDGPESRSLRADAEEDGEAWLALADVAGRIDALFEAGPARDPVEAQERLATLRELWRDARGVDFVAALRPQLAEQARAALGLRFRELGLEAAVSARVERLDGGVLRLRYDFEDPGQLADFPAGLFPEHPCSYDLLEHAAEPSVEVRGGELRLRGDVVRGHVLAFEGPTRLTCTWQWVEPFEGAAALRFAFGLAATRVGHLCALSGVQLERYDKLGDFARDPETQTPFYARTRYRVELLHDGEREVRLLSDGQERGRLPCLDKLRGGVFLWSNADLTVGFDELVIEGRPTAASLEALGASWIEAQLAELGLAGG